MNGSVNPPIGSKTTQSSPDYKAEDFKKAYEKASAPNSGFTFSAQGNAIKDQYKTADDMFGLVDKDCNGVIEGDEKKAMANLFHGDMEGQSGTGLDPKTDKDVVNLMLKQYGLEGSISAGPIDLAPLVEQRAKANEEAAAANPSVTDPATAGAGAGSKPATDKGVTGVDPNAQATQTNGAATSNDLSKVATTEVSVQKGDGMSHVLARQYPDLFPPKAKDWSNLPAAMALASQFGANGGAIGANKNAKDGFGLKAGDKLALPSQEDFVKLMKEKSTDQTFTQTASAASQQLAKTYPKQAQIFTAPFAGLAQNTGGGTPPATGGTPAGGGTPPVTGGTPAGGGTVASSGNAVKDWNTLVSSVKIGTQEERNVSLDASTIRQDNKEAIQAGLKARGQEALYNQFVNNQLNQKMISMTQQGAFLNGASINEEQATRTYAAQLHVLRTSTLRPANVGKYVNEIIDAANGVQATDAEALGEWRKSLN